MRFLIQFVDGFLPPEPAVLGTWGAGICTQAAALHNLLVQMVEGLCRGTMSNSGLKWDKFSSDESL